MQHLYPPEKCPVQQDQRRHPDFISRWSILSCILLAIFFCQAGCTTADTGQHQATDRVLRMPPDLRVCDLGPWIAVLRDPSNTFSVHDLEHKTFQENRSRTLNFGVSSSAYWLKFKIREAQDSKAAPSRIRILDLGEGFSGRTDWILYDGHDHRVISSGKEMATHAKIRIPSRPRTFYLKVSSTTALMLYPRLFTWEAYIDHVKIRTILFGLFYGIIVTVAIYNMFLFFSFHDRSYLWYGIHLFLAILYFMGINGTSSRLFLHNPEFFGVLNRSLLGLLTAFMGLLTKSFLLTKVKSPGTDRMILTVSGLAFAVAIINLIFPARMTVALLIILGVIVPLMMIIAAWNAFKKGFQPAKLFMLAWMLFVVGILLFGLTCAGTIPFYQISFHLGQISMALTAILLSLALSDRIKTLQETKNSLENSMNRLKIILDSMEIGVFLIENDTKKIREINLAAEKLIGQPHDQIIGRHCWQFIRSALKEPCPVTTDQYSSDENREDVLNSFSDGDIPILKRAKMIELDGHQFILESFVDISNLRKAQAEVNKNEAKFRALFEFSRDAVMILDQDRFIDGNQAALKIFGLNTIDELIGKRAVDFSPQFQFNGADSRKEGRRYMEQALSSGSCFIEWLHQRANGEIFPAEVMLSKVEVLGKTLLQASARDITKRKSMEEELKRLALTDPLTGADNRRSFLEKGARELIRARRYNHPLSFLMMDIDHFKIVNDTYGHQVGDEVLKTLVSQTYKRLRDTDILGRLGGEEFAVILPETDADEAMDAAERLRLEISAITVASDQGPVRFTVSIGMSVLEKESDTIETISGKADAALYHAKQAGRNCVIQNS